MAAMITGPSIRLDRRCRRRHNCTLHMLSIPASVEAMAEALLEARGITKHYGQVRALDGASFTVYPGEVVALIGDNGAGKSTLVKALSGALRPDGGQILIKGKPVQLSSPLNAREHGIETVYQDLALAPDLDAAANLHLGREIYRWWPPLHVLNKSEMRRRAVAAFADLGVELKDVTPGGHLVRWPAPVR